MEKISEISGFSIEKINSLISSQNVKEGGEELQNLLKNLASFISNDNAHQILVVNYGNKKFIRNIEKKFQKNSKNSSKNSKKFKKIQKNSKNSKKFQKKFKIIQNNSKFKIIQNSKKFKKIQKNQKIEQSKDVTT